MTNQRQSIRLLGTAAADNFRYWFSGRWRRCPATPDAAGRVPADFIGICVASSPDAAGDDYVIARLKELGIRAVRLDFAYDSRGAYGERFLKRLLDESFQVCLHLVQPPADARAMSDPAAQDRWRSFVAETLAAHAARLDLVEIGATCNRRRWSGYTPATFLLSWQIAWEEAQRHKARLAAPNVTDFEPCYNVAILSEMRRCGMPPATHTDNLFVERATEPEAFDHKILGRRLAGLLRCNLVRKARVLDDIGRWAGVPETLCAHVAWSLRRIARVLGQVEEKQADYAARYACLAAASGALRRFYWGPLIGQREGLIDDGTSDYPDIPHVAFYGHIRGKLINYRLRPAFLALQTANRFLAGAGFRRKIPTGHGLEILEFSKLRIADCGLRNSPQTGSLPSVSGSSDLIFHVVWTTNGNAAEAAACYPSDVLKNATVYSRDGAQLAPAPDLFTESPVYLVFPGDIQAEQIKGAEPAVVPGIIRGVRFAASRGAAYTPLRFRGWTGFHLAQESGMPFAIQPLLEMLLTTGGPEDTRPLPHTSVILRDSRNRVWSIPSPGERGRRLVVKHFRPRGFWRRLLQCNQPDRAQRSWNGAQELLRRGIATPQPIAFVRAAQHPKLKDCYYVCRAFENGWSIREAFTAFRRGATRFQGKSDAQLFEAVALFLRNLHDRGVFFRDLSAGNLLFRCAAESEIEFALIDTARARFYPDSVGLRQRLGDLMRLCHPLNWKGRNAFVGLYLQYLGRRFNFWLKIPFAYYDAKHWIKNTLKGK